MKVLQISPRLPYPLIDGGAVGVFKATQAAAQLGADITFVTYPETDPKITREGVERLSQFAKVHLVGRQLPSRNSTLVRTLFKGAYPVERRMMPEMFTLLRSLIAKEKFDLVHVDHAHMGKYALWLKKEYGFEYILREHNFESLIYERFAETQTNPVKKILARTHGRRLRLEETRFISEAAHVCPITHEDLKLMQGVAPNQNYTVIPAGVDIEYFKPTDTPVDEKLVLWVGGLNWDPNRDAVEYFLHEIWPIIRAKDPSVRFEIVGDGSESVGRGVEGVQGFGRVPDIRPWLEKAAVLVVPLRVGGGMRLKILDFFAAGKAVVTTTIGVEGNMAVDGKHLVIEDTPEVFADATLSLLTDQKRRNELALAGRELVEEYYSWEKIGRAVMTIYETMMARKAAPISVQAEL
ncbi:MAG TPA: glycosyltransferase family 4 protein [Candidatus Kapabacteria bacterium]|nr:glycosyltransferase family 4 protein [Candidatus Kapabacteria bacterium]